MTIAKTVVSKRKNAYGEFVVRAYDQNGNRCPNAYYYTNDLEDAENTARAMVNHNDIKATNYDQFDYYYVQDKAGDSQEFGSYHDARSFALEIGETEIYASNESTSSFMDKLGVAEDE